MRANGYHAFKDRCVAKNRGFKVLHIPYFDWELLAGDAKRAEYLKALLAVDKWAYFVTVLGLYWWLL